MNDKSSKKPYSDQKNQVCDHPQMHLMTVSESDIHLPSRKKRLVEKHKA